MPNEADVVFERAAELFGLLSAPMRLRILSELCNDERNVSQLLDRLECSQPNLSQHLALMYRMGVLNRRREGAQMYYRLANQSLAAICRTVCTDIAIDDGQADSGVFLQEEQ